MERSLAIELEQIARAVLEVRDLIDLAADESAVPADVTRAERRLHELLERWQRVLARLGPAERAHAERELGVKLEVLKAHLLKLREAP